MTTVLVTDRTQIHGTAVAVGRRGCLILGPPGTGKSRLAVEMIALGARLVADDRVDLSRTSGQVLMSSPPSIRGLIEVRCIGLVRIDDVVEAPATLVVDLARAEQDRLPLPRTHDLLGVPCPAILAKGLSGLPAILMVALTGTIVNPERAIAT